MNICIVLVNSVPEEFNYMSIVSGAVSASMTVHLFAPTIIILNVCITLRMFSSVFLSCKCVSNMAAFSIPGDKIWRILLHFRRTESDYYTRTEQR